MTASSLGTIVTLVVSWGGGYRSGGAWGGLFTPALCPGLQESDKDSTLNRILTLPMNCDRGKPRGDLPSTGLSRPNTLLWPLLPPHATWTALRFAKRRLGTPRGVLDRRFGGKDLSFLTMLPCLYFKPITRAPRIQMKVMENNRQRKEF